MKFEGFENKWARAAVPAILIHICIGTVYAWSVFKADIANYIGAPVGNLEWAFSLAIFALGISAAFAGKFVENNLRKSAIFATLFFISGLLVSALAIFAKSFWLFLLGYGILQGIGLGLGYLTPIKNLTLWFKSRPGVATGIAIAGFGLAKMIWTPVIEAIIDGAGVFWLFPILSACFVLPMIFAIFLLARPKNYKPEKAISHHQFRFFRDKRVLRLWLIFYINIAAGLALISQEKNLLLPLVVAAAVIVLVSVNALINCLGRLSYSSFSDFLAKRENIYRIIFITEIVACLIAGFFSGSLLVVAGLLIIINFGYGGGFSSMPAVIREEFGSKNLSAIHGVVLSAWAIAGLTGNQISAIILANFNSSVLYFVLAVMFFVGLIFVPKLKG